MPTPVPSIADVITAIAAVITGLSGTYGVRKGWHGFEDDVEYLKNEGLISAAPETMNTFFIRHDDGGAREGRGSGEGYLSYAIEIRYWSLRTNVSTWDEDARTIAHTVAGAIANADSVFAIGGQRQIGGSTAVSVSGPREAEIRGTEGPQKILEAILRLEVEARAWS